MALNPIAREYVCRYRQEAASRLEEVSNYFAMEIHGEVCWINNDLESYLFLTIAIFLLYYPLQDEEAGFEVRREPLDLLW